MPPTTPRPYPDTIDDRLRAAGPHLGYEWAMLVGGRHADWHKQSVSDPRVELAGQHAGTEVVLLHARLLFEFLTKDCKSCKDDVRAIDLLDPGEPNEQWKTARNLECPHLRAEMDRLNQRLSHLSYAREEQPVGWNTPKIVAELEHAIRKWSSFLPPARRDQLRAEMEVIAKGACPF